MSSDWAQRAEPHPFMTNNFSNILGPSGFESDPLSFESFTTARTWDPIPGLVSDRWWTLPQVECTRRFNVAFGMLLNEELDLEADATRFAALASADWGMWWSATVLGGHTLAALKRLSADIEAHRRAGELERAWRAIEAATGFFAVAVWLQKQQPFLAAPPTAWVRELIERCGRDPETLVSNFAFSADVLTLAQCVTATVFKAWSLECDPAEVFALHLFAIGEPIPDHVIALNVVGLIARNTDAELADALERGDLETAGHLITVGTGALELACRLGNGYGLADNDEWEQY